MMGVWEARQGTGNEFSRWCAGCRVEKPSTDIFRSQEGLFIVRCWGIENTTTTINISHKCGTAMAYRPAVVSPPTQASFL